MICARLRAPVEGDNSDDQHFFAFASGGGGKPARARRCVVGSQPAWAQDAQAQPAITGAETAATAAQPVRPRANAGAAAGPGRNRRHRLPRLPAERSQQEEESRPDRRVGQRRGHRQAAGRVDRRSHRAPSRPHVAAPLRPRRRHLHPRLRSRTIPRPCSTDANRRRPATIARSNSINIPSELINQVNVYKTPMASIIGQGIAGTVDLRTIRPLEFGKRVISIGGRAVYPDIGKLNPDAKKYGYRVNGVYVDQFADGRARSFAGGQLERRAVRDQGIQRLGLSLDVDAAGDVVIGGPKSYSTSTELKRLGLAARSNSSRPTTGPRRSTASIRISRTIRSSAASKSRCGGAAAEKFCSRDLPSRRSCVVGHVQPRQQCRSQRPAAATCQALFVRLEQPLLTAERLARHAGSQLEQDQAQ